MKKMKLKKSRLMAVILAVLLAFSAPATNLFAAFEYPGLDVPVRGNRFLADYDTADDVVDASNDLNERIAGEGMVLLKNEDNALPLGNGAKISLFGKRSADSLFLHGGSGAGAGPGGSLKVSLLQALSEEGFQVNSALVDFYNNNSLSGSGPGEAPVNGTQPVSGYNTGETPVASYAMAAGVEDSYAAYNDAAVVVFSRIGGEGFDLPRTMTYNGQAYQNVWSTSEVVPGARKGDDHYMQLDKNESDLLKYLGGKFSKVVVLLNTGSQIETGFLDDVNHYGYHPNTKACLWTGFAGGTGTKGIAKILNGKINPSGRTVDTWARDFKADPVWMNFGNQLAQNGNRYTNNSSTYVEYREGIYMGYRYWETRGFDENFSAPYTSAATHTLAQQTTTTAWDSWYKAHVVRPFGFGISYSAFTQTILNQTPAAGAMLTASDEISITVRVTNTGTVAGKEVVQLYYTAPYIAGEIEKAHVVLGAFAKTGLLEPNAHEDIVLKLSVRDMASYDWNDLNGNAFKGYELDPGIYTVRIMKNANEQWASSDFNVASNIQYQTDGVTNNPVGNLFDAVSNEIGAANYFSRDSWTTTFPAKASKPIPAGVSDEMTKWGGNDYKASWDEPGQPWVTSTMPTTGAQNGLVLDDMVGIAYDDPKWNSFMDQLSAAQMRDLTHNGSYSSGRDISEFGVTSEPNADGPTGWIYGAGRMQNYRAFWVSETILAATWSKELAYEKGRQMGNEALFAKIVGWYAPAVNTHRSPFSGRNFEYYSEDGHIAGILSGQMVRGAADKGLFAYVKHFGVNDQETNRVGLLTWANEQSMREIYLKPFELAVKKGNTIGIMSSLNRLGPICAGADYRLLTALLRNEWGFKGSVVTDSFVGTFSGYMMVRAGGNLALGSSGSALRNDATSVTAYRNGAKGVLFTHANSMAMNTSSVGAPRVLNTWNPDKLKVGIAGIEYNETVATATIDTSVDPEGDNAADIRYELKPGSTLPEGLTLNEDGTITGKSEDEAFNFGFTVMAVYQGKVEEFAGFTREARFAITIIDPNGSIIFDITDSKLKNAIVGEAYNESLALAEIDKPDALEGEVFPSITYALKNGSLLPAGLTLSSAGMITGTCDFACADYEFTVIAEAMGYKAREITFNISVLHGVSFAAGTLQTARLGKPYVDRITPAVSDMAISYTLKPGASLPQGLKMTSAGYITGTPTTAVTDHSFTVVAGAALCETIEAVYKISVGLSFSESSTLLTAGQAGKDYIAYVDTAGKTGITYALKAGSVLPAGLTLSEDGIISGKPTESGTFDFTVTANAAGIAGDEFSLKLFIQRSEEDLAGVKGGCGSVIYMNGGFMTGFAAILLCAVCIKFIKRKKGEN